MATNIVRYGDSWPKEVRERNQLSPPSADKVIDLFKNNATSFWDDNSPHNTFYVVIRDLQLAYPPSPMPQKVSNNLTQIINYDTLNRLWHCQYTYSEYMELRLLQERMENSKHVLEDAMIIKLETIFKGFNMILFRKVI